MNQRYVLYLDESTYYPRMNKKEHFLSLAGIVVPYTSIKELNKQVDEVKREIWGESADNTILHCVDVYKTIYTRKFNKRKYPYYDKLLLNKNKKLLFSAVNDIIRKQEIVTFGASASLWDLRRLYGQNYNEAYVSLFEKVIENYTHFLISKKATGSVIFEKDSNSDGITKKFYRIKARGTLYFSRKTLQPTLETIKFIPKSENVNLLQLADFISNSFSRNIAGEPAAKPGVFRNSKKALYDGGICRPEIFGNPKFDV